MENFRGLKSQPRLFEEMIPVLRQKPGRLTKETKGRIIYDVYRGVDSKKNLRYDMTVIHPIVMGKEPAKTYGHYHTGAALEITEVLSGVGLWLIQKYDRAPEEISEVYLVEGRKGEKIIYPDGFGHVTINPQKNKKLITSNWVSFELKSDYEPYTKLKGAAYYILGSKNGRPVFEKNKNYKKIPKLIELRPREIPEMKIVFDKPLRRYGEKELEFLTKPEKYKNILTIEKCFKKL